LSKHEDHAERLHLIFKKMEALISIHKPAAIAIEAPFFGKNVQSMLKLGRAQGVAMAAGLNFNIPIFEYSPKKVKQSVTGNGNASKEQVSAMVNQLLQVKEKAKYFDATDALAVAVCHHFQSKGLTKEKKSYKDWSAFLSDNPDRIK
ncbi:MAG: crossover junction endodeoxyribonuclease RuvC, partial [Bacteroidia bacterium]